jgi:hypothetical protein
MIRAPVTDDPRRHGNTGNKKLWMGLAFRSNMSDMTDMKKRRTDYFGLKQRLIEEFQKADISKVELARRLNVDEKSARRLLNLDTTSHLKSLDAAFEALGVSVSIVVTNARTEARTK